MKIHWRHTAEYPNKERVISPRYFSPKELLNFSDPHFEDYCILHPTNAEDLFATRNLGYRVCYPGYCDINRYSPYHCLFFVLDGEISFNNMTAKTGDIIYCSPHLPHTISSSQTNPCTYAWIAFEGDTIEKHLRYMGLLFRISIYQSQNPTQIYSILNELIYNDHSNNNIFMYYDSMLLQLLSLSFPSQTNRKEIEKNAESTTDTRLQLAIKYISYHYCDQKFRVKQVADSINISEQHLRKLFQEELGLSVLTYVIILRLEKAKHLLRTSLYNVNEIAEQIGYENYYHFSTIFKKHIGYSPKQYRKIHQGN